jgi:phage-related tail protein
MELRYQQRFDAQQTAMQAALAAAEKAVLAALAAAEKAVSKAEDASNDRFEAGNKIKEAMEAQGRLMATRRELEDVQRLLRELTDRFNTSAGQSTGSGAVWGSLPTLIGIGIAVAGVIYGFLK